MNQSIISFLAKKVFLQSFCNYSFFFESINYSGGEQKKSFLGPPSNYFPKILKSILQKKSFWCFPLIISRKSPKVYSKSTKKSFFLIISKTFLFSFFLNQSIISAGSKKKIFLKIFFSPIPTTLQFRGQKKKKSLFWNAL